MPGDVSLDGRTLVGVSNADTGEVDEATRFRFEQAGDRIYAHFAGVDVVDGHLVCTFDGRRWEVRYTQINAEHETATVIPSGSSKYSMMDAFESKTSGSGNHGTDAERPYSKNSTEASQHPQAAPGGTVAGIRPFFG